jgi:hypothetical protein
MTAAVVTHDLTPQRPAASIGSDVYRHGRRFETGMELGQRVFLAADLAGHACREPVWLTAASAPAISNNPSS